LGDSEAGRTVVLSSLVTSLAGGALIFLLLSGGAAPLSSTFFDSSAAGVAASGLAVGLLVLLGAMEFVFVPSASAAGAFARTTGFPCAYGLLCCRSLVRWRSPWRLSLRVARPWRHRYLGRAIRGNPAGHLAHAGAPFPLPPTMTRKNGYRRDGFCLECINEASSGLSY
jgi:hypothetical protein